MPFSLFHFISLLMLPVLSTGGGCIEPFFKYSKAGTDCTQISNMSDVACVRGSCQVFKCAKGFVVGSDGASCVPDSSMGNDTESVLVLNPSLEH